MKSTFKASKILIAALGFMAFASQDASAEPAATRDDGDIRSVDDSGGTEIVDPHVVKSGDTTVIYGGFAWLRRGSYVASPDGSTKLWLTSTTMQVDVDGSGRWHTDNTELGDYATFGTDGNFVLRANGGDPVWASNTTIFCALTPCTLHVQNDGNVVIYVGEDPDPAEWVWATGTNR